jgi:Mg/Co/Ni transporter MgtE
MQAGDSERDVEEDSPLMARGPQADGPAELRGVGKELRKTAEHDLWHEPFAVRLRKRAGVLVALLIFQSCSSFILASFEALLKRHSVVVFFLTMLVGAGGNAGNQAAVLVIRGLATGEITARSYARYVLGECQMSLAIAVPMVVAGYCRVKSVGGHSERDALAISASLLSIVVSSVVIGSLLPLALHRLRVDPAHAGATIQVIMDLAGVIITCNVCNMFLRDID